MQDQRRDYDPNGVGVDNGNFLGLPRVAEPGIVFVAVPFDVTVSYGRGTSGGPANVLAASRQLDVSLPGLDAPHEIGFAWRDLGDDGIEAQTEYVMARFDAEDVIRALEQGREPDADAVKRVNAASAAMNAAVLAAVDEVLVAGAFPVVVGGEHAVALGAYRALSNYEDAFGILQIDAHMDLRVAYEGFDFSHASVMDNALVLPELRRLVQVGIRDFCPEELVRQRADPQRIKTYFDAELQARKFRGETWASICEEIVAALPHRVWISFDVDGLDPSLCMHTGTPVPGGLGFAEAQYLLRAVIDSGREVIGMDIVEVAPAPHEYEGSVAARLAYDLACRAVLARRD